MIGHDRLQTFGSNFAGIGCYSPRCTSVTVVALFSFDEHGQLEVNMDALGDASTCPF